MACPCVRKLQEHRALRSRVLQTPATIVYGGADRKRAMQIIFENLF